MNRRKLPQSAANPTITGMASLLCLGVLAFPGALRSQGVPARLTAGPTYTASDGGNTNPQFPNVDVVFTLTSPEGAPIQPKTADLKLLAEDKEIGSATSIRTFEQAGYGITAILALDASGSMRGAPINAIHASIAKFVDQARAQDKAAVVTFADDTLVDVPFGAGREALANELNTVKARGRFTHLYDGLLDALDQFTQDQPKRRQLIVISDGHDEGSSHAIVDVVLKAKSLGVIIDSIGLTRDSGDYLVSLQQISQGTDGSYRRANSAEQLEGLIGQGIQAARATPVAVFHTKGLSADGNLHSVQLHWQPGDLTATTFILAPKALGAVPAVSSVLHAPQHGLRNARNPLTNPWVWALGGCFLAGVILLIISLVGPRGKALPNTSPPSAAAGVVPSPPISTAPMGPAAGAVGGAVAGPWGSLGANPKPVERTITRLESAPSMTEQQTGGNTKAEQVRQPLPEQAPEPKPGAVRSKTQLAVFFSAPPQGPYARLEMRSGEFSGKIAPVTNIRFNIGAVAGNELVLANDPTISGRHARLTWEDGVLKIEDVNSTNGTFVNSTRLGAGRHLLRPGDEIRVGQTVMIVQRA
jgi:von Willebrand factor type A domain/FHA domain